MCGRYTLSNAGQIALRFDVAVEAQDGLAEPRYNIAPSQEVPVIVEHAEGRRLLMMRWGFQPAWRSGKASTPPINARAETLRERPLFRSALGRQRCLIPADGFYEWQAGSGRRAKQPYFIHLRDGSIFAFAGLYTEGPAADGQRHASCVLITTTPNALMVPFHDRMPAILDPVAEAAWLDPTLTEPEAVLSLLRSYPAEHMEAYPVSQLVSSVRNDGPELVRPAHAFEGSLPGIEA